MILAVGICTRIAVTILHPLDSRLGAAIGLLALGGFSLRGGDISSVIRAASDNSIFLLLAGETLLLSAIVFAAFYLRQWGMKSSSTSISMSSLPLPALIQALLFAILMVILAQSNNKGQSISAIFFAAMLSGMFTRMLTGQVSTHAWILPPLVGIIGFLLNSFVATDLDIGQITSRIAGLARAIPLDYVAFGPIGVLTAELIHRNSHPPTEPTPPTAEDK